MVFKCLKIIYLFQKSRRRPWTSIGRHLFTKRITECWELNPRPEASMLTIVLSVPLKCFLELAYCQKKQSFCDSGSWWWIQNTFARVLIQLISCSSGLDGGIWRSSVGSLHHQWLARDTNNWVRPNFDYVSPPPWAAVGHIFLNWETSIAVYTRIS